MSTIKQKNAQWRQFRKHYSKTTEKVIRRFARGFKTTRIAKDLGLKKSSVAAYLANLTQGKYHPFAYRDVSGKVKGDCF